MWQSQVAGGEGPSSLASMTATHHWLPNPTAYLPLAITDCALHRQWLRVGLSGKKPVIRKNAKKQASKLLLYTYHLNKGRPRPPELMSQALAEQSCHGTPPVPEALLEYLTYILCCAQILFLCIGERGQVNGNLWSQQAPLQIPTPPLTVWISCLASLRLWYLICKGHMISIHHPGCCENSMD